MFYRQTYTAGPGRIPPVPSFYNRKLIGRCLFQLSVLKVKVSLPYISTCIKSSDVRAEGTFLIIDSNPPDFTLGKMGSTMSFLAVKSRGRLRTLHVSKSLI